MTTRKHYETPESVTVDDLMKDLKAVVNDAEELLRETENQAGERIEEIRARATESLGSARERLRAAGADLGMRARAAGQSADDYVHENPWPAIGVAAGIGLLVGLLGRRR